MHTLRATALLISSMILSIALASPCAAQSPTLKPDILEIYHSDQLQGALGHAIDKPIQVRVLGPSQRTLLGAENRLPLGDVTVLFELSPDAIARGAKLTETSVKTDAGGVARTQITLGDKPGEYDVTARVMHNGALLLGPITIRTLGGIIVHGDRQDAKAGETTEHPLDIYVESAPGVPLPNAEVRMSILESAGNARILPATALTDANGHAQFQVTPGSENGSTDISASISQRVGGDSIQSVNLGSLRLHFFSFAPFSLFIAVLGGLAVFIFGMNELSTALTLIAGDRLRQILNVLTRNRIMGLLAGTAITGLIQSSSATSVMVLGFINAGLFELRQAIGVVFGANIGTTVTAQMISFKLDNLALPAIAIGVIILFIARSDNHRLWAKTLIGFGLLFLGLEMMSSPLKDMKDSQALRGLFSGLSCVPVNGQIPWIEPLKGILVGALVTCIIQSSSASMGLLLALVATGLIDAVTAFPIIRGFNIGTTITAVLASIGSNRNAKRAALAHVLFNVFGVAMMYGLFFVPWHGVPSIFLVIVNDITPGNAFAGENVTRFVANAHTLFNIIGALIFLPFVGAFARLCYFLIPKREEESSQEEIRYLEPRLLATPSVAIAQVYRELAYMSRQGQRAIHTAAETVQNGLDDRFEKQYERIRRREARLDRLQDEIIDYIEKISQRNLTESQSKQIPGLIHAVNDAERVGDRCVDILKLLRRIHKRQLAFTPEAQSDLVKLFGGVEEMYQLVLQRLDSDGPRTLDRIHGLYKKIGIMMKDMRKAHLARLEENSSELRSGVVFLELITHLGQVSQMLNQITLFHAETNQSLPSQRNAIQEQDNEDEELELTT